MPVLRFAGARILVLFFTALLAPSIGYAQQHEPIGPFAVDFRGIFARHKQEPSVATDLDVAPGNMPTRSFGLLAGAHVYPFRAGKVTFGFGGHVLIARGSRTLEAPDTAATTGTSTTTDTSTPVLVYGTVRRHFTAFAPEVSLNFGHKSGWSYISGGIGRSILYVDRQDAPATSAPGRQTINYGAGARWFNTHHVAFEVDVRWYSVAEQLPSATLVGQPRTTLLVLSGGISLK